MCQTPHRLAIVSFFIVFAAALLSASAFADKARAPVVLAQKEMGKNACGPCAFVDSLLQSGNRKGLAALKGATALEKAKSFAAVFGSAASVVYGKSRSAYSDEHGTTDVDLVSMVNAMQAKSGSPAVSGEYLLRREDETPGVFAQRIRKTINESIADGFCPLLSIRSVKAERSEKAEKHQWNAIVGHWVCVVGVEEPASDDVGLLVLRLADSNSGKIAVGLLTTAEPRNAVVPMTFTTDDNDSEAWDWVAGKRCAFLNAPSMSLGTQNAKWHERTYIAARYLVFRKKAKSKS